jgi:hypothetical protein
VEEAEEELEDEASTLTSPTIWRRRGALTFVNVFKICPIWISLIL